MLKKNSKEIEQVNTSLLEKFYFEKNKNSNIANVVFIHGYAANRYSNFLFEERNRKYNYYTFNLPGSWEGKKKFTKKDLKINLHIKLIVKFLEENELTNVVLIGHSLGASLAAMVYKKIKDDNRIIKIILVSPLNITSIPKIITKVNAFFPKSYKGLMKLHKIAFNNPEIIVPKLDAKYDFTRKYWYFININNQYIKDIQWELMKPSLFLEIEKAYASIEIPALLIVGKKDKLVDANNSVIHLKHKIKDLTVVKIDNVGHGLFAENEELYYKTIINFIEKK
ncbi:MAG: alpha/beta hydrolase [Mycoplasmoidaceae bacterium]